MTTDTASEFAWDADACGNHRAVIEVRTDADAVVAHVPWCRRDADVAAKGVLLFPAGGPEPIRNVVPLAVSREAGTFAFQPTAGSGTYFFYYLPYTGDPKAHYPTPEYLPAEPTAEADWLARHGLPATGDGTGHAAGEAASPADLPEARFVRLEAVSEFHALGPMERPAGQGELADLLARHSGRAMLLFGEDRTSAIRMRHDIPAHWTRAEEATFAGEARPGEFYVFQVGVFAARADLLNLTVTFSDLTGPAGTLAASRLRCFNTGGVGWNGRAFRKAVNVLRGDVQALWCGLDVPADAPAGTYTGRVTVAADGQDPRDAAPTISVAGEPIACGGDDEAWRLSRLRWLDSTKGSEAELVPPFTPLTVDGRTVGLLGREVALSDLGLPRQVTSFFTPEVTAIGEAGCELLAEEMVLAVMLADGSTIE